MKKISKFLSIILTLIMVISIIPITASAATYSGACGDNVNWTYDSSTYTLTISGTGAMYDYKYNNRPWESYKTKIKTIFINKNITKIGTYAFHYFTKLESVEIPDSVITIGNSAFSYCKKLASVSLSNKITIIDEWTFAYCKSLTNMIIPRGVTSIGDYAFSDCYNLATVTIPDSVTTIRKCAFQYCESLTEISIPSSVVAIGETAFLECSSITDIIVDNSNQYFSSDEYGVLFNKDKTTLIQYPIGNNRTDYTIPDSVTTIDNFAFYNNENFTRIIIPDSVTTIGDDAFAFCYNLTDCNIGESVKTIGKWAFAECYNLTTITIPDSVFTIDDNAFYYCYNLLDVTLGENVTTIGSCAFYDCNNLTHVYFTGTERQWEAISIGSNNQPLLDATIHYNYHVHKYDSVVTKPTCTEQGYTTYTCECGDSYVADYVDALGHSHTLEITTPATHTTTGIMTYTCACGDSYTEVIAKLEKHNYESVVTPPTCTEQGYTTYICECGDSYVDDYVNATGHNYSSEITTPATHTKTGVMTYTCTCGDSYTEVIEKLEKHNYESVVTEPTCTEQGYTTYTCECGDSYVANYVDALDHTEETIPAVAPSCTETGLTEGAKCSVCGETLTEQKELPANGHTPANAVEENYVAPTCTENGSKDVVVYCSVCDEEISRETVTLDATGHADNDGDGYCDSDNELLDPSVECECNCHKSGISKFFFNFILFFQKIFGSNKTCACGVAHY